MTDRIPSQPARCAYIINGWQPVLCTIISAQPMYYWADNPDGDE